MDSSTLKTNFRTHVNDRSGEIVGKEAQFAGGGNMAISVHLIPII